MTAIVKDDEDTDEERRRQHGQRQRNPIRYGDAAIDCIPERDIGTQGIEQLPRRFRSRRPLKSRNDVLPERSIRGGIRPIDRIHACWATTPSRLSCQYPRIRSGDTTCPRPLNVIRGARAWLYGRARTVRRPPRIWTCPNVARIPSRQSWYPAGSIPHES